MGSSSKVILVGATSLIVGVYAISLKKAETEGLNAALKNVSRVQNERFEDAALRTALHEYVAEDGAKDKGGSRKGLAGKTFSYSVKNQSVPATRWTPARVDRLLSVTYDTDDKIVTISAVLQKVPAGGSVRQGARKVHRGPWEVTAVYAQHDLKTKKK